jgi:hypothetical protein
MFDVIGNDDMSYVTCNIMGLNILALPLLHLSWSTVSVN